MEIHSKSPTHLKADDDEPPMEVPQSELNNSKLVMMGSLVQSVGSTTALQIEDDASSKFMGETRAEFDGEGYEPNTECDLPFCAQIGTDEHDGDGYETPNTECNLPYCGSIYEPECDPSLEPSLGMVFESWEKGKAFYKAYAHEVGFSVRTWTQHKDNGGVAKWKRFVCSRQGWRREQDNVNEQDGTSRKNYSLFGDVVSFDSTYRSNRHFLNRRLHLLEFWIRYETALEEQRQLELRKDNNTLYSEPKLETSWCIESHARNVYTHTIFGMFQGEVIAARDKCDIQSMAQAGDERTARIRDDSGKVRVVRYNMSTRVAKCSCKLFESIGILCCHIILVLKGAGCNEIPSQYLLRRWTKTATHKVILDSNGQVLEGSSASLPPSIRKLYSETWTKIKSGMHVAKQSEEKLEYFLKCINDAIDHISNMGPSKEKSKVQEFESFVGATFPSEISIYPPEVVHTKGNGKRLKRGSELSTTSKTRKRTRSRKNVEESYMG